MSISVYSFRGDLKVIVAPKRSPRKQNVTNSTADYIADTACIGSETSQAKPRPTSNVRRLLERMVSGGKTQTQARQKASVFNGRS
jgi:hypothetical protein